MQNLHAFKITFLGCTNTKGSRVKIQSLRFNKSKIISYDYKFNSIQDIAVDYLNNLGFDIIGQAEFNHDMLILSNTFKSL